MSNSSSVNKTLEMTRLALFIAMNCVSAYLIIPLPFSLSPIALQPMIVDLAAFLLSPRQAFFALFAYILIGMIGVPVFTGGTAGPGKIFGPTGGYIWGFLAAAVLVAFLKGRRYNFKRYAAVGLAVGVPVVYIMGAVQLKLLTDMDWYAVFVSGVLPFIPLDIVKCIAAAAIARPLHRIFDREI